MTVAHEVESSARRTSGSPWLRVLIVTADVGESHLAMARALRRDLELRLDVASVVLSDDFSVLGRLLGGLLPGQFRLHLGRLKWTYDIAYRLFTRVAPARAFGEEALYRLGGSALLRETRRYLPDVVVSTYPVMNPVLAKLRVSGRLEVPVCAVVGPLAGVEYWAQPGIDRHLTIYPEAVAAVERLAGAGTATPVRPLVAPEFFEPRSSKDARRALGLPGRPLVLLSGGGWGAGDVAGMIRCALCANGVGVIAVTGRNAALRSQLEDTFAGEQRVRVLGFTDRMSDLLAAADVFVTATGGVSCIEARLRGCPVVTYGFCIGHVRDNTEAMAARGFARPARTLPELRDAITAALTAGRPPVPPLAALPRAADVVADVAARAARRQPVRV